MMNRSALAAVLVALAAGALTAQEPAMRELGGSSGELRMVAKGAKTASGSLGMRITGNGVKAYEGTFGGTLVKDRMWFFASAERQEGAWLPATEFALPEQVASEATAGKLDAQIGDRQTFSAAAFSGQSSFAGPQMKALTLPSSFLSLHYTGVVKDNLFFSATVTRRSSSGREWAPQPAIP
jgi:hypothetical protein